MTEEKKGKGSGNGSKREIDLCKAIDAEWIERSRQPTKEGFKSFCPYVIRDEHSNTPIVLSQIHTLTIDFVFWCMDIGKFPLVMLPFEHGKSAIFSVAFPLWWWGAKSINETIKLVSGAEEIVKTRVKQVRDYISRKYNNAYRRVFPQVKPDLKAGWQAKQIHIEREVSAFPSLWAHPVLGTGEGGRCGLLILDDCVTRANSLEKDLNRNVIDAVEETWLARLHPDGFAICLNTPWSTRDLVAHIIKSRLKRWAVLKVAVNKSLNGYNWQVIGAEK